MRIIDAKSEVGRARYLCDLVQLARQTVYTNYSKMSASGMTVLSIAAPLESLRNYLFNHCNVGSLGRLLTITSYFC
jgi:hypothetical protein